MMNPDEKQKLPVNYWLGFLSGVINGISMRSDVPEDIRTKCEEVLIKYEEWKGKENG